MLRGLIQRAKAHDGVVDHEADNSRRGRDRGIRDDSSRLAERPPR